MKRRTSVSVYLVAALNIECAAGRRLGWNTQPLAIARP